MAYSLFVNACSTGCRGCTPTEAYHAHFPPSILQKDQHICHLEALNVVVVVVVKLWTPRLSHQLVHLYSDNATAVAIFQAGRGRDEFIQACSREVWITCATWVYTLVVGHIPGSCLADTVDALSRWHLGQGFRDRVASLIASQGLHLHTVPDTLFVKPDTVSCSISRL